MQMSSWFWSHDAKKVQIFLFLINFIVKIIKRVLVSYVMKGFTADHHSRTLQGIISSPQFPYNAVIIIIIFRIFLVFSIQIRLKATKVKTKLFASTSEVVHDIKILVRPRLKFLIIPVKPPSSTIWWCTRTARWRFIIIPVYSWEIITIVHRKWISGVSVIIIYPEAVIIIFIFDSKDLEFVRNHKKRKI